MNPGAITPCVSMAVTCDGSFTLAPTATILPWRIRTVPSWTIPSGVTRVPRNARLSPDCAISRHANSPSTNNQVIFAMLPMVRSAAGLWRLNRGHGRLPGKKKPAEGYAAEHNGHPNQGGQGIVHKVQKSH